MPRAAEVLRWWFAAANLGLFENVKLQEAGAFFLVGTNTARAHPACKLRSMLLPRAVLQEGSNEGTSWANRCSDCGTGSFASGMGTYWSV